MNANALLAIVATTAIVTTILVLGMQRLCMARPLCRAAKSSVDDRHFAFSDWHRCKYGKEPCAGNTDAAKAFMKEAWNAALRQAHSAVLNHDPGEELEGGGIVRCTIPECVVGDIEELRVK